MHTRPQTVDRLIVLFLMRLHYPIFTLKMEHSEAQSKALAEAENLAKVQQQYNEDLEEQFTIFRLKNNRHYTKEEEFNKRKNIFLKNVREINSKNKE